MYTAFFLGANSKHGFHSLYNELIDLESSETVYILKGGPGSGKSSLMRRIMNKAVAKGEPVEQIYCSSDPDSLDAIILPQLKKAVVDGTAPHVVEPHYPIAVEQYVNLGNFADSASIKEKKKEIIAIKENYSKYFEHVYRLTSSAATIQNEIFDIALAGVSLSRIRRRAQGIISREIHGRGSGKHTQRRFLSAISPKGFISLLDGIECTMSRIFVIEDNFGLSHLLLAPILVAIEHANFPCYACMSPLHPDLLEHLIIPELSLAFFTSDKVHPVSFEHYRRVRLDTMIDPEALRANKQKIAFFRKLSASMIDGACSILRDAKSVHDELEELYNPHIDFDALYKYADSLAEEILSEPKKNNNPPA